jgi:hypothetical protein
LGLLFGKFKNFHNGLSLLNRYFDEMKWPKLWPKPEQVHRLLKSGANIAALMERNDYQIGFCTWALGKKKVLLQRYVAGAYLTY